MPLSVQLLRRMLRDLHLILEISLSSLVDVQVVTVAVVQQDLQRHTHLNHLQLAVLRFRRVMLLQKENFRDFSEEKKLLLSLRNVMTSVQVVYP